MSERICVTRFPVRNGKPKAVIGSVFGATRAAVLIGRPNLRKNPWKIPLTPGYHFSDWSRKFGRIRLQLINLGYKAKLAGGGYK